MIKRSHLVLLIVVIAMLAVGTVLAANVSHPKDAALLVDPPTADTVESTTTTALPAATVKTGAVTTTIAPTTTTAAATDVTCDVGGEGTTNTPAAVKISGTCQGVLIGPFACKVNDDDMYVTGKQTLSDGRTLYLTLNVESYKGPGDYPVTDGYLQIQGTAGAESWTNRSFPVSVAGDMSLEFAAASLPFIPGTGATGNITISGHTVCS